MALNFPDTPDLQLENSPLIEVVCQVRFPPILRIAAENPTEFQDRIRDKFPNFEQEVGVLFRILGPTKKEEPTSEVPTKTYRFSTSDQQTTISLAADFYALSTNRYANWDGFANHLKNAHAAVQQTYKPAYATRIGLRYINKLTVANTGCRTLEEMFALLRPELTAHARSDVWGNAIEMRSRLVLADGSAKLTLNTGFGEENGMPVFVLDLDYFEEGSLPLDDVIERCTRYNEVIYRAFRWCVLDGKLAIFKPREKETRKK